MAGLAAAALLERACAGSLDISTHVQTYIGHGDLSPKASALKSFAGAYCWIDFLCIPQAPEAVEERVAAISCISDYIGLATHFFVLAGPWKHGSLPEVRDVRGPMGACRVPSPHSAPECTTQPPHSRPVRADVAAVAAARLPTTASSERSPQSR